MRTCKNRILPFKLYYCWVKENRGFLRRKMTLHTEYYLMNCLLRLKLSWKNNCCAGIVEAKMVDLSSGMVTTGNRFFQGYTYLALHYQQ